MPIDLSGINFNPAPPDFDPKMTVVANIAVLSYTLENGRKGILLPGQVLPFNSGAALYAGVFKIEYRRYQILLYRDKDGFGRPICHDHTPSTQWINNLTSVIIPDSIVGHLGQSSIKKQGMDTEEFNSWIDAIDCRGSEIDNDCVEDLIPVFYGRGGYPEIKYDEVVYDVNKSQVWPVQRADSHVWMLDSLPRNMSKDWPLLCDVMTGKIEFHTTDRKIFIGPPSPKFVDESALFRGRQTLAAYKASGDIQPTCVPFPMIDQYQDTEKGCGNECTALAAVLNAPAERRINKLLVECERPRIQLRYG
jgi:hypothetical protein